MENKIDLLQEKYNKEVYAFVDSIGLIALLCSNKVYPVALEKNGNYSTCVFLKEDGMYIDICTSWDNGVYDDLKIFNKQFSKIKKAFATGNLGDMKAY